MAKKKSENRCRICKNLVTAGDFSLHFPICTQKSNEDKVPANSGTSEESEVTESMSEGVTSNPRRSRRRRPRRNQSRERPATATLLHPVILDETLKDKVDMTLTKKELLAAVKLCHDPTTLVPTTRTASNLARLRALRQQSSNDETGSSSGSAEHIYLPPRGRRSRLRTMDDRPLTSKLERPSNSDLDVPNIRYYSKPRNPKARLSYKMKTEARRKLFAREEIVAEPCLSCGRSDQPERFHTHPRKFKKSPLREAKNNENNTNNNNENSKNSSGRSNSRLTNNKKAGSRSLSPRKSSPEKSPTSEDSSPINRQSEGKENSERPKKNTSSSSPLKAKITRTRSDVERIVKPKRKNDDITVSFFTRQKVENAGKEDDETNGANDKDKTNSNNQNGEGSPDSEPKGTSDAGPAYATMSSSRPTGVKCKICNKEFGKASIKFHEPQCERKKISEERKERERQEEEQLEKTVTYMDKIGEEELTESFDAIWEQHMLQLKPCGSCGRTFFPDRLIIHERSCKGDNKKKRWL